MPVTISVEVESKQVRLAMKALASEVKHPMAALRAIGEYETTRTRARFDTSTDPDGVKWPDYVRDASGRSRYLERKVARGYSPKLLIYTGAMMQNIHAVIDETVPSVSVGTDVKAPGGFPYPIAHQEGTATIPQRRFLGLGIEDQAHIVGIIADRLQRALRRR